MRPAPIEQCRTHPGCYKARCNRFMAYLGLNIHVNAKTAAAAAYVSSLSCSYVDLDLVVAHTKQNWPLCKGPPGVRCGGAT